MFAHSNITKSTFPVMSLALSVFSLSAHATLTSYSNSGKDLVYSSVSGVTWTKDGNLMKTLMGTNSTAEWAAILNSVAGNNGLTAQDFYLNGSSRLNGAIAFINYLNSIGYGGINSWYLPTVANTTIGTNTSTNGNTMGDELVELFYQELNGTANNPIPNTSLFDNVQSNVYWEGTVYEFNSNFAWAFGTYNGNQGYANHTGLPFYAWAVSSGRINPTSPSTVPIPAAAWLFGSCLVGLAGLRRRQN